MTNPVGSDFDKLRRHRDQLAAQLAIARTALEKIADPRLRDHQEPDKYTEVGCMMYIAEQALALLDRSEM